MTPTSSERVIVGVDGSPESIIALRRAAEQARCRAAWLCVVHVGWRGISGAQPASHGEAEARAIVDGSLAEAFGGEPSDLLISRLVAFGRPGSSLVASAWRDNDILVVGSRSGRRWRRRLRRSVSRYCTAHAHGPVLVIRDDEAATAPAGLTPVGLHRNPGRTPQSSGRI